jgi:hypothetical protein
MTSTATHEHTHEAAVLPEQASSASVAIDIGPGRGALVIYPAERFRTREIEISRLDGDSDGRRVHTGVHERKTHAGAVLTAIFGSLASGDYVVWEDAETAGPTVTVPDGAVAELGLD